VSLELRALAGLPEVRPGDDVAALVAAAETDLRDGDVLAVAHKVVSKSEGRVRDLDAVEATARARELAVRHDKDARAMQVVLDETAELVRAERGVVICRTRHGLVCANAGVDASNAGAPDRVVLLPLDPDASARGLRARLRTLVGVSPAIVITDSFGRAWRHGQCDIAIGCAGLAALEDWRGRTDSEGRTLHSTWMALADEVAAAADLARAKDARQPVVLLRGLGRHVTKADGPGGVALRRPLAEDLFR